MREQMSKFPPMFLTACSFLCLGTLGLFCTFCFFWQTHFAQGFLLISLSLLGFGTGEILNHPRERAPQIAAMEKQTFEGYYRRRNTCGLGNLLDIIGLLLFFGGISSILY